MKNRQYYYNTHPVSDFRSLCEQFTGKALQSPYRSTVPLLSLVGHNPQDWGTLLDSMGAQGWDGQAESLEKAVMLIDGYTVDKRTPKTMTILAPVGKNAKRKKTRYTVSTLATNAKLYEVQRNPSGNRIYRRV